MSKRNSSILLEIIIFFFLFLTVGIVSEGMAAEKPYPEKKTVNIAVLLDGPSVNFLQDIDIFKKEIHAIMDTEYNVGFKDHHIRSGDCSIATINKEIDLLLKDPTVDVVLALGIVASNEICKRRNFKKPVIAPWIVDEKIQNLPKKDSSSGVRNLFYVNSFSSFDRSFKTFSDITPFNHMTVLADRFTIQSIPSLRKLAMKKASEHGFKISFVEVGASIEDALLAIPSESEVVMVTSLEQIRTKGFKLLVDGLLERKLPSYSYNGPGDVENGILGSTTPKSYLQNMARHVAINLQEIMDGEDAGKLPVGFSTGDKLTINMATARSIGVYPSWKVRTEADLINEYSEGEAQVLTIEEAVFIAAAANLDLAAAERSVAAGEQNIYESRSRLLPNIDIGAGGRIIDKDRAETSQNLAPEKLWAGSATATQIIYSDKAWSDYTVQKYLQTRRIEDRDSLKLDVIQSAATAYLNVLRAKAIERIQKDNLKLTRENLERARIRQSIGAAGPDEVYRWESQIAGSRQTVLLSESISMNAMTSLNRILNRPLREKFETTEIKTGDPMGILEKERLVRFMSDPNKMGLFRDFIVQEGLEAAPELRSIQAGISARERIVKSSQRDFWLPTFSLEGNVTEAFSKDGEGSGDIPGRDNTDWDAGVYATFPLFAGGRDVADYKRTREELKQLRLQQRAARQKIEEKILNSVHLIRASYPGIELSRDALIAAEKNLELVTDSYSRGIKSIIELLDAQNQALVARQKAANAVYNFMIDIMAVQRSIGQFVLFSEDEKQQAFFQKLDEFLKTGLSSGHQS